jgi:6-phosphofructokinase 1
VAAIDAVHHSEWGMMAAARGNDIVMVPLADTVGRTRPVDLHLYRDIASVFFG